MFTTEEGWDYFVGILFYLIQHLLLLFKSSSPRVVCQEQRERGEVDLVEGAAQECSEGGDDEAGQHPQDGKSDL